MPYMRVSLYSEVIWLSFHNTKNPAFAGSCWVMLFLFCYTIQPSRMCEKKKKLKNLLEFMVLVYRISFFQDGIEHVGIVNDEVGECFSVQFNMGFF